LDERHALDSGIGSHLARSFFDLGYLEFQLALIHQHAAFETKRFDGGQRGTAAFGFEILRDQLIDGQRRCWSLSVKDGAEKASEKQG
jgi:hypothetical protein